MRILLELVITVGPDVLPQNGDVVVPVWPRLLVPETDSVAELVNHNSDPMAVRLVVTKGESLPSPLPTHVGPASMGGGGGEIVMAVCSGIIANPKKMVSYPLISTKRM